MFKKTTQIYKLKRDYIKYVDQLVEVSSSCKTHTDLISWESRTSWAMIRVINWNTHIYRCLYRRREDGWMQNQKQKTKG